MVIMNDLEWPMLSYYVIYDEKFKNVMQWTEKEALNMIAWVIADGSVSIGLIKCTYLIIYIGRRKSILHNTLNKVCKFWLNHF